MIKNLFSQDGVEVMYNNSSSWPTFNPGLPSSGQLRYNGQTQNFEVYDGYGWTIIYNSMPHIKLSTEVNELLQWAKQKRDQENKIKELALSNSTIADAKKNLDMAQEKLDVILALCQNTSNGDKL